MIPTMIIFGLLTGRWWRSALVAAAVLWPLLLVISGVSDHAPGPFALVLTQASILTVANTGVGVAIHQVLLYLVRKLRIRRNQGRATGVPRKPRMMCRHSPGTTKPPGP